MSNTNDAGAAAPAFVLHDLKSSDVWQLVRVLKRFNLREARKLIDADLLKKSQFKTPQKLVDGELVPMARSEWTTAQRKAFQESQKANEELIWQVLDILINNISGCEDEVNKLLAMGIDKDVDFVRNMDANDYLGHRAVELEHRFLPTGHPPGRIITGDFISLFCKDLQEYSVLNHRFF